MCSTKMNVHENDHALWLASVEVTQQMYGDGCLTGWSMSADVARRGRHDQSLDLLVAVEQLEWAGNKT